VKKVAYLGQVSQKKLFAYVTGILLATTLINQQAAYAASYESVKSIPNKSTGSISQYLKRTSNLQNINNVQAQGENPKEQNETQGYVVYILEANAQSSKTANSDYIYPLYFD
jgi:hypothetical protein